MLPTRVSRNADARGSDQHDGMVYSKLLGMWQLRVRKARAQKLKNYASTLLLIQPFGLKA